MVGTFFLKAGTYEFMKYNSMNGGQSHFYSFEYEGENSVFNLLFTGGDGTPPVPHGVTHADELIYLFTTGLFPRKGDDQKISEDLASIWTNFAINGEFASKSTGKVPNWTEDNPKYLKIDVQNQVLDDYIVTWSDPDRSSNCQRNHQ